MSESEPLFPLEGTYWQATRSAGIAQICDLAFSLALAVDTILYYVYLVEVALESWNLVDK